MFKSIFTSVNLAYTNLIIHVVHGISSTKMMVVNSFGFHTYLFKPFEMIDDFNIYII